MTTLQTESSFAKVSVVLNRVKTLKLSKGKLTIEKLFKITFFPQNAVGLEYLTSVGYSLYMYYTDFYKKTFENRPRRRKNWAAPEVHVWPGNKGNTGNGYAPFWYGPLPLPRPLIC